MKMDSEESISEPQSDKSVVEPASEPAVSEHESLPEVDMKKKSFENSVGYKVSGNHKFGEGNFAMAREDYTAAIDTCPDLPDHNSHKSILYSNRAATYLKLELKDNYEAGVADCSTALELDENNFKARFRRGQLYEVMENYEDALADFTVLAQRSPPPQGTKDACARLPNLIEEKNEKMKTEMMGKLKDLGNLVLKPFGLSTDNFKMEPQASGGYSVKFEPNKKK